MSLAPRKGAMRRQLQAFLGLASILLITAPAFAGSTSAQLNVSVQVIARTILTIDSQPATVTVTADDLARGYIDLPQAVAFHVRSNASNGYTVQFDPLAGPFARADVTWGNSVATVGSDGSWMTRPYQQGTTTGSLTVRLALAPGAQPGSYAWPLHFGADSL